MEWNEMKWNGMLYILSIIYHSIRSSFNSFLILYIHSSMFSKCESVLFHVDTIGYLASIIVNYNICINIII
jgi:hypothetical protein